MPKASPKRRRVAKSYTPSEKAQILEHAAKHGVSDASTKFKASRFSIYEWQRRVERAAKGQGDSPTSGPAPKDIEAKRDEEILTEWRKHPGLGPSQIRNQLRRANVKVSVNTVRRVMEDAGYRPPKVKREPHDQRYEAVRPNHLWHLDFLHRHINRQSTFTLIIIDDYSRYVVGHGVDDAERADLVIKTFEEAVERHGRPERVMDDKGSAFWSWRGISRFTELLTEMGIDQVVAEQKEWNGKIEVFNANLQQGALRRAALLRRRGDEAPARRASSLVQPRAHAPRARWSARPGRSVLRPRRGGPRAHRGRRRARREGLRRSARALPRALQGDEPSAACPRCGCSGRSCWGALRLLSRFFEARRVRRRVGVGFCEKPNLHAKDSPSLYLSRSPPSRPSCSPPRFWSGARSRCTSQLPAPTVEQILTATGATKSRAYELAASLADVLPTLTRGRGRPPAAPPAHQQAEGVAALTMTVLDYVMRHPGCVDRGPVRQRYSDGFRHFILELRALASRPRPRGLRPSRSGPAADPQGLAARSARHDQRSSPLPPLRAATRTRKS